MTKRIVYAVGVAGVTASIVEKIDDKSETLETREFLLEGIPAELQDGETLRNLAAYGLSSFLQDRTSGIKDPAEKLEKFDELMEQLQGGIWRTRKEPGERKAKIAMALVVGLQRFLADQGTEVSVSDVQAKLEGMDKDQRKSIASLPGVKAHRAAYEAEVAQEKAAEEGGESVDLSSLF